MSRIFHVWWLVIVAVIIIALIVVWAMFAGSQSLSANNLDSATASSLAFAQDKTARQDRGTYVINRDAFQKRLSEYKIKAYGKVGSKQERPSKLYVHYLVDDKDTDNSKGNWVKDNHGHNKFIQAKVVNGYINGDNYNGSDSKDNSNKYLAIRGVQVSVIADGHNHKWDYTTKNGHQVKTLNPHYSNPNDITNVKNKYVATLIVQDADADKYSSENKPLRDPNNIHKDGREVDDPTVNSFQGTDTNNDSQLNANA